MLTFEQLMSMGQGDWMIAYIKWIGKLKVGDRVTARWTHCHSQYEHQATIVGVNNKSVRVKCDDRDREITVSIDPTTAKWSINNGCLPPRASEGCKGDDMDNQSKRTVPATNFMQTLHMNISNPRMSDREFREFVRRSMVGVIYEVPNIPPIGSIEPVPMEEM